MKEINNEIHKLSCDFLIVGAGMSGCFAAMSAKAVNPEADVLIIDKANIDTSGAVLGLDHQNIHEKSIIGDAYVSIQHHMALNDWPGLKNREIAEITLSHSNTAVSLLENLGVKFAEDDGTLKLVQMVNHAKPLPGPDGKIYGDTIFYRGSDLKKCIARGVKNCGVRIMNRLMMTSVLTRNDTVTGITAVNIRTAEYYVIMAKAVLLACGTANRMFVYPYAPHPNNLFLNMNYDGCCGEGIRAAYKAGARVANMEFNNIFPVGAGKGIGHPMYAMLKNAEGEQLNRKYPRVFQAPEGYIRPYSIPLVPPMPIDELDQEVIYGDSSDFDENDCRMQYFSAASEKPHILKILGLRGDLRKAPHIEIRPGLNGLINAGCISENSYGETRIRNLYTSGEMNVDTGGGAPNCTIWGDRIGRHVAEIVPSIPMAEPDDTIVSQIEADYRQTMAPLSREHGVDPLELEDYIRTINYYYAGIRKSEQKLTRALELFEIIKRNYIDNMVAATPHELMRALETDVILDISILHAKASLLRKESRMAPGHYRMDYPVQDDENWMKAIIFQYRDESHTYTIESRG